MSKPVQMCDSCKQEMIRILDERIKRTLKIGQEEGPESMDLSRAECFHFMELQRILRGKPTCGLYDDFGEAR